MKLGKLEQITDLRSIWKHEANDFTPWLAKEENLAALVMLSALNLFWKNKNPMLVTLALTCLQQKKELEEKLLLKTSWKKLIMTTWEKL